MGVIADKEILVERILSRARESDAKTREDILRKIERELGLGEPDDGQQVGKCMEKVDLKIPNMGTLEDLQNAFLSFYNQLSHDI